MSRISTHYDNLKITRDAPEELVRAAYKSLMQFYHPEKFAGQEQEALELVETIRDSYEVLIDPIRRAEHDLWIDAQEELVIQHSQWLFDSTLETALQEAYQTWINSESTVPQPEYHLINISENDNESMLLHVNQPYFKRALNFAVISLVIIILVLCFKNNDINRNISSLKSIPMELFKSQSSQQHG